MAGAAADDAFLVFVLSISPLSEPIGPSSEHVIETGRNTSRPCPAHGGTGQGGKGAGEVARWKRRAAPVGPGRAAELGRGKPTCAACSSSSPGQGPHAVAAPASPVARQQMLANYCVALS